MQNKPDIQLESNLCENCGRELFGRTDKRFCNDSCRNEFNRKKKQAELLKANEAMPEILKVIKRNYEILCSYGEIEKDSEIYIEKRKLQEKEFNFKFFTSVDQTEEPYHYCFERGWRIIGDFVYIKDNPLQAQI